ncbi:MAG: Transcriptional regulator, MarR family [Parcubacteria group bacterium GW2011_GWA2_43_17]|nr:MAG: Transcriptional regulator, MarR family [Parcubacteria group bacterium GW2011_GWA2_43_17]KKT90805.1 MAG: Transcriptional regulator, MarR family [Parcubacteria group bacterium GW2011_GWF2_45_11]KKT98730.1 MAG: Transcriptional regulator, MarR family [Parcubacteria group bacterium GW2011_GWC2_45_15]OGY94079.1 MAG: DNA protecting protein DprA [Candidatus Komeilibacteria bacterium RIFOXYC2_FULL_45_12]HAH04823.1 DNA-protecting protein DprA [Candidatus Komeilibacteria bacterium]
MKSETKYLMALAQIDGLGPVSLQKLLTFFNSAEACFKASFLDLKKTGLPENLLQKIIAGRNRLEPEKLWQTARREGLEVITYFDEQYPELLKTIYAPPLALYCRGNTDLFNYQSLAVVGSRKISPYAQNILPDLLQEAAAGRIVIISGLAYGVDALAHQIALDNQGLTMAVAGSGLAWDYLHPAGNRALAKKILNNRGLLISEFPPFERGLPFNFPRRNRLISGLSRATLIVEASQKSGALITAKYALEQGREVLAVPGPINQENSRGANYLIQNGAKAVTSAEDILEIFGLAAGAKKLTPAFDPGQATAAELMILKTLNSLTLHIDKIIEHCTLETPVANALLMQMELKGWIKNLGGQKYISLIQL